MHGNAFNDMGVNACLRSPVHRAGYHSWRWCHSPHPQVPHQQVHQEGVGVLQRTHAAWHCLPKLLLPQSYKNGVISTPPCQETAVPGCYSQQCHANPCKPQVTDRACSLCKSGQLALLLLFLPDHNASKNGGLPLLQTTHCQDFITHCFTCHVLSSQNHALSAHAVHAAVKMLTVLCASARAETAPLVQY